MLIANFDEIKALRDIFNFPNRYFQIFPPPKKKPPIQRILIKSLNRK